MLAHCLSGEPVGMINNAHSFDGQMQRLLIMYLSNWRCLSMSPSLTDDTKANREDTPHKNAMVIPSCCPSSDKILLEIVLNESIERTFSIDPGDIVPASTNKS